MKKVSIVTRTKNRPTFLRRAIESVARQTYGNYIHVIVNDGGNKSEIETIISTLDQEVANKIQLFHRDRSSNAPDTIFNESIDRVDSEYFTIHDDDDTWHSDFLNQTVKHMDQNSHLGAVVVRADKIIETVGSNKSIRIKKRSLWMPDLKTVSLYRQCIDNQLTPIATLFRRSAYQEVGKFDDTLPVVGDWEFGVRLLQKYDVDFINPGYSLANYHHRQYKPNTTGNTSFAGNDKHRYYTNLVMNRYLRKELAEGYLGVGYIMSKLKYDQSFIALTIKKFLPTGMINYLKKRVGN